MIGKFNSVQKSFIFKLLPVAIAVPFILQTITGANLGTQQQNYLVTFSNKDVGITYNEFQQEYQQRYNQLLQNYGQEAFEQFMTPANEQLLRQAVLDNLINNRLRILYAQSIGMTISDNEIIQNIRNNQMFQGADGQYSEDRIRAFLNYYGITTEQYFAILANDLRDQGVTQLLNNAYITTPAEVELNARLATPTSYVQVAKVEASATANEFNPSQEQIQEYYDMHRESYAIPAKATLSYIRYNRNTLAQKAPKPTQEQIQTYYDNNPQLFNSTIYDLSAIVVADQKTAQEVEQALKDGMSFTDAVKKYSTDVAAQFNNGELGRLTPSQLPDYLKEVVPLMQDKSYSAPIADANGEYHIVYLNNKETSTIAFAAARAQIEQTLTQANQQTYLQDLFAKVNEVVESQGNIAEVAKILDLPVSTTPEFTANNLPESVPRDVARLSFTGDMQVNRVNSPQGIADSQDEIITQLDKFQDTIYPTLDEIKDKVTEATKLSLAQAQNLAKLQDLAVQLNANPGAEKTKELLAQANVTLSEEQTVDLLAPQEDQVPYFNALFTSKYAGHPEDYLVVSDNSTNSVYLIGVLGFTVEAGVDNSVLSQFSNGYLQQVNYEYNSNIMQELRKVYDVKINYDLLGDSSNN
ncbi:hypothetical protein CJP74_00610 [Psittacicella melopsittaci]|uniref:Periplasmic chaperone PpiD n=1 Tax=Psittacicella melopsittaci TaxID=2028576 RepID=A0A3A1Y9U2_9GAMM|nr:SurA N-terminal domain-containing protein [Psittacicella melopsittaci]RIY33958.1 hypothetical protein CJP74_00610 [Psittacicella melopsittaci]